MRCTEIGARWRRSTPAAATSSSRSRPTKTRSCPTPGACFGALKDGHPATVTEDAGHGRTEIRKAIVVSVTGLAEYHDFPGLNAFGRVEASRETAGAWTSETRYFALSWMPTPDVLLATTRTYWAIENALHCQLDLSFREDAARNRKDNGPGNIAVLRRRALDIMQRAASNGSLSIKLKRAGWDEDFLCCVLNGLAAAQAKCDRPC